MAAEESDDESLSTRVFDAIASDTQAQAILRELEALGCTPVWEGAPPAIESESSDVAVSSQLDCESGRDSAVLSHLVYTVEDGERVRSIVGFWMELEDSEYGAVTTGFAGFIVDNKVRTDFDTRSAWLETVYERVGGAALIAVTPELSKDGPAGDSLAQADRSSCIDCQARKLTTRNGQLHLCINLQENVNTLRDCEALRDDLLEYVADKDVARDIASAAGLSPQTCTNWKPYIAERVAMCLAFDSNKRTEAYDVQNECFGEQACSSTAQCMPNPSNAYAPSTSCDAASKTVPDGFGGTTTIEFPFCALGPQCSYQCCEGVESDRLWATGNCF
jgi:hypothetical protein